jgi:hypothetical protein
LRFAFFSRQQAKKRTFADLRETNQSQLHFLFLDPPSFPFILFALPG